MTRFGIEVRGSRNGTWGPWKETRQAKRYYTRAAAERWIQRRQFVLRIAYKIVPPDVLRVELRVVEIP